MKALVVFLLLYACCGLDAIQRDARRHAYEAREDALRVERACRLRAP